MTQQANRLESGGILVRERPVEFEYDGIRYEGFEGDTLASALMANGIRTVGRSFKYHRARGIYTAGSHEPNALVELRTGARREPNTLATMAELHAGLIAASQNCWPTVRHDLMSVNSALSAFLVAGFYYKTFKWPRRFWTNIYEPVIRRAAGLGHASGKADPDRYEKSYAHCDVLVVGAGPAGIAAADSAARAGARVILCDEHARIGGALLNDRTEINGQAGVEWALDAPSRLSRLGVKVMPRTTVAGWYDDNTFAAAERVSDHLAEPPKHLPRQKLWRIAARHVVVASGAIERPLLFSGNDRPGVMLASSARAYVNHYAVRPGSRAVVCGNNDDLYTTAADLRRAGIAIAAIVDSRSAQEPSDVALAGSLVSQAVGGRSVRKVAVTDLEGGARRTIKCDLVCVAGGWMPNVSLLSQRGVKPAWNEGLQSLVPPETEAETYTCAGACAGRFGTQECLAEGARAGRRAAAAAGIDVPPGEAAPFAASGPFQGKPGGQSRVRGEAGKTFVDLQNDVTARDIELAAREGYGAVEHLKRYTTMGMATDQGRLSNVNGLAVLADVRGVPVSEVGTTTYRPPYTPVTLGTLAGHFQGRTWRPRRLSGFHDWAAERGAEFVENGLWMRWNCFAQPGESLAQAAAREVKAVRSGAGMCDVSTLGKIEIQGPDAVELIDHVYAGNLRKLTVGRSRFALMLREDGMVFDDGTVTRLARDHFLVTTTTGNAGRAMEHLEYCHQVLWPKLDLHMVSVTDAWSGLSIAGPRSRDVLETVVDRLDLSNEAFPFLSAADTSVCAGVPARLMRISYSGELAYEIYVPYQFAEDFIRTLEERGKEFGLCPYGLEALGIMRIEKGHVAGSELNGRTTPADVGLEWAASGTKSAGYIGRALSAREGLVDPEREVLVGLKAVKPTQEIAAGSHLLNKRGSRTLADTQGYVSAACFSPTLEQNIALAFLKRGRERHGEVLRAANPLQKREILVEVTSPVFYDPESDRVRR